MNTVQFDRSALVLPPKAVVDFLARLDKDESPSTERRHSQRKYAVLQVAVVPVDSELRQTGECFLALSKDLSAMGMAIVHTRAITSGNVVVELTHRDQTSLQLLASIVRCQPIHRFYEIGLRFVTRLAAE